MKTALGSLLALDEHLKFTSEQESRQVGRLHTDAAVRYLLGIPRELPESGPDPVSPGLRLEGHSGMWLEIVRRSPGRSFSLSMKDGEVDQGIDEMSAVTRVRLFIEHWGEETDLTSEIRLSPEQRRMIVDGERARDEERRQRMADGPGRVVFQKRVYMAPCLLIFAATAGLSGALVLLLGLQGVPGAAAAALLALGSLGGLWLLFKSYRVEVDRSAGLVRVVAIDGASVVGELAEFQHADVRKLPKNQARVGVYVLTHDGRKLGVGSRAWSTEDAGKIAEAVNDALDVQEVDRKFLAYRRQYGRGQP